MKISSMYNCELPPVRLEWNKKALACILENLMRCDQYNFVPQVAKITFELSIHSFIYPVLWPTI